jgi:hypothetical protein
MSRLVRACSAALAIAASTFTAANAAVISSEAEVRMQVFASTFDLCVREVQLEKPSSPHREIGGAR